MEDEVQRIVDLADNLNKLITEFVFLLGDTPVHKEMRDAFSAFDKNLSNLRTAAEGTDADAAIKAAENTGIYALLIGQQAAKIQSSDLQLLGKNIQEKAVDFRKNTSNSPINFKPLGATSSPNAAQPSIRQLKVDDKIQVLIEEHEKHDQRIKKLLNENELRIADLEKKLRDLEGTAQAEIDKITQAYSDGLIEVDGKKSEIDGLLGHVAGRAVAGDYATSAAEEKFMADWLRNGSLLCMALIAGSLGYSFWETIGTAFDWQKSLFRITLTFLLSVPAAYLARESAKHREQQYQHLQTSLDLKALSPFVASLPSEEQHKIKIAIASKIFANRDFSKVGADPYPLNTHEIIIELIKKLDISKAKTKAETKTDQ